MNYNRKVHEFFNYQLSYLTKGRMFSWLECSADCKKGIFGCSLQKMVNNHHWDIKRDTYQVF